MKKVGVLSLQGSFAEHLEVLGNLADKVYPYEVKSVEELEEIDYLIIPGGESTTLSKLLEKSGLDIAVKSRVTRGMPVWGTCAGMILLGEGSDPKVKTLGLIPIKVERNAYGSQLDSFNFTGRIDEIDSEDISFTFIRAPIISEIGKGVKVLLEIDDKIVAARKDNVLVTSFHPELTKSEKVYEYFLNFKTP